VQQGGGVDEFDHGGQFVVGRALVAVSVGHQQYQHGTDAFAAGADDVFGNLIDEADLGMQLWRITVLTASMSAAIVWAMVFWGRFG
jgi:predicted homoserine dehydrogenase-like protein